MASDYVPVIWAVEGPAGAGKSTWIAKQPENLFRIKRPEMPRNQGPVLGSWSSSLNEYAAITYATMFRADCLVDRFLLSRAVYRAIEEGSLRSSWYRDMRSMYRSLLNTAVDQYHYRVDDTHIVLQPHVHITVLIPTEERLNQQRETCDKMYPFKAGVEIYLYDIIAEELSVCAPLPGVTVEVLRDY